MIYSTVETIKFTKCMSDTESIVITFTSGHSYLCQKNNCANIEICSYSHIKMNCDADEQFEIDKEVQWCILNYKLLWDVYFGYVTDIGSIDSIYTPKVVDND